MPNLSRRQMLQRAGGALAVTALGSRALGADPAALVARPDGVVSGQPTAEKVGAQVLAEGGNAIDAIVAAALTAAVAAPHQTGMGGYGGHMTIGLARAGTVACIDFNSAAPAAMRADLFARDIKETAEETPSQWGWLAAGVPGVLAGMQFALDRFGKRDFRESVAPAIELARAGILLTAADVTRLRGCRKQFEADDGSRKLYLGDDGPISGAPTFRNPDLAAMLTTLAERNSVDSFYRGDIAQRIADAFKKHGGLVNAVDLAAYRAREVEPLALRWQGFDIRTAPLTAGGLTVLQALAILRTSEWEKMEPGFTRAHLRIEALRFAWHDRLRLLGDPQHADVPMAKLLSEDYAREAADRIQKAVKSGTLLPWPANPRKEPGTIHLSAVDRDGNMAACTLTHGNSFGARVTVDGLGLTLGHGMSRFDPHPDHPNAPGPGKRPLHNMCPTIVLRDGRPVLALGARGGRHIPNAVFGVLTHFVGLGQDMATAVATPRFHTEGDARVFFEKAWPAEDTEAAQRAGYEVKTSASATVSAVSFDPKTGECRAANR